MASTGGRETPPMATFGHFFKNRRFGLHFAWGMGQKLEKKIFRGKPPVMSGEVYRCPMDSPELRGGLEKKSTKNRNVREASGRPGGGRGDIWDALAPYTDELTLVTCWAGRAFLNRYMTLIYGTTPCRWSATLVAVGVPK